MTYQQDAYATATTQDGHNLRRRNVPDHSSSNGSLTQASSEVDNKKAQKVGENMRMQYI